MPSPRPAEDRMQARRVADIPLKLKVIDAPTPPSVDVDKLLVQDSVDEVDAVHQCDPAAVISVKGIAASETTRRIAKYNQPSPLPTRPLAWSPIKVRSRAMSSTGR